MSLMQRASLLLLLFLCIGASPPKLEKVNDLQVAELAKAGDVVILNFWATWCAPCVEEIPIFVKVQKRLKNVKVIGVSMDESNEDQKIEQFLQKHPANYRIALWTGNDLENMVNSIDPKWNGPIPATFIFKNGKRVYSKVGQITESELTRNIPQTK